MLRRKVDRTFCGVNSDLSPYQIGRILYKLHSQIRFTFHFKLTYYVYIYIFQKHFDSRNKKLKKDINYYWTIIIIIPHRKFVFTMNDKKHILLLIMIIIYISMILHWFTYYTYENECWLVATFSLKRSPNPDRLAWQFVLYIGFRVRRRFLQDHPQKGVVVQVTTALKEGSMFVYLYLHENEYLQALAHGEPICIIRILLKGSCGANDFNSWRSMYDKNSKYWRFTWSGITLNLLIRP